MAEPFETIEVTSRTVACDGGNGPLGHPRVYLTIAEDANEVVCPYCSRSYHLVQNGVDDHAA